MNKLKRQNHSPKGLFLLPLASYLLPITTAASIAASPLATLQNWQFDPNAQQLEIILNQGITPQYFVLSQPSRIVVDLPNTKIGNIPSQQNYAGIVQKVRISQFQQGITRIVLDLADGVVLNPNQVELQPLRRGDRTSWSLRPIIGNASNLVPATDLSSPATTLPPAIWNTPSQTTVTVPPLNNNTTPPPTNALPPAIFAPQPGSIVKVPPVNPAQIGVPILPYTPTPDNQEVPTTRQPQPSTTQVDVVEFGQPLPRE